MTHLPHTQGENDALIQSVLAPHLARISGRPVVLVDGDRTLSPDDTSLAFLAQTGIDSSLIKRRFQDKGYVFEAFRYHAELHVQLGARAFEQLAPLVAATARLHDGAILGMHRLAEKAAVFVVTAGIPAIWRSILDRNALGGIAVLGGIDPALPFVFGRAEKGLTARMFCAHGSSVLSIGDSDVDTEMLLASQRAVVTVNHRDNADLMPHLANHSALWQIAPQGRRHVGIQEITFETLYTLIEAVQAASPASSEDRTCL